MKARGSRAQVMHGTAKRTSGRVTKKQKKVEEVKEVSYENLARGPIPAPIMERYGLNEYDY